MIEGQVTTSDGVRLHYLEGGSGQPLVMIPGWSQTAAEFHKQFDAFTQHARVIAVDMRGHGESEKPEKGYRMQRLAKDLYDLVGALDLEAPDLLGHSMGSSVIWAYHSLFAAERPPRKLVFVDQSAAVVTQPGWDGATIAEAGSFLADMAALFGFEEAVRNNTTAEATKDVIRGMFTASFPEEELLWVARENIKFPRHHAAALLHDHCMIDWRSEICSIRFPTLVVGGETSIFAPSSQAWIAAQIPGAEVDIFPEAEGGSHFMFLEAPDRFNRLVTKFLTKG